MTPEPQRASSRFRSGSVSAPATPEARLERLHGDGEALFALFAELASDAARTDDLEAVLRLVAAAAGTPDLQRAYQVRRFASELLIGVSLATSHGEAEARWATPLDHVVQLLVPVLEEEPHEPELLNLLGLAVYELGATQLARRLFDAIRTIDPTHQQARANLRACKDRLARGGSLPKIPAERTRAFDDLRPRIKRLADVATRLQDRTVSLCMIVKDEEEMLPGCLAAVQGHVDQIVVVDTGSSDRTREIAAEFGAEVVEFAWTGSFSDARNESLRHATGDWVLYLDADEHVVEDDARQLRELARRTWVEGFQLVETHFTGDAEVGGQATHTPMRLFQRRDEYSWRGEVHEQIMWAMPNFLGERFQQTGVRVDHYGYLAAIVDGRDKNERNLEILLQQVEQRRDAFTLFNIGTEYASMGRSDEARRWFDEALEAARDGGDAHWREQQFAPLLVQRTVAARRNSGDVDSAVALADEALAWWPQYTDLVFEQALVHAHSGAWANLRSHAERLLELGDAPARFVAGQGKGTYQARALLAQALRQLGDPAGACEQLELALEEAPHFLGTVLDLTESLLLVHDAAYVDVRLDELLGERAHGAAANMLSGAVFHEHGDYEIADARYARVLTARPEHGSALVARAELRLAQGEPRAAWEDATRMKREDGAASRGARTAFLAAVVLGEEELLAEPFARLSQASDISPAERAAYGGWRQRLLAEPSTATPLVPADDTAARMVLSNLEALAKLEAVEAFETLHPLLEQTLPDGRTRHLAMADLYLRRCFADMAGDELVRCAEQYGPDAPLLTRLGKVATMKELWEDAVTFLEESLRMEPDQYDAVALLDAVRGRVAS